MSFFSNPRKALRSVLGGGAGAVIGSILLPGAGTIIGAGLGQAAQNKARGKSAFAGALKGAFGAAGGILGGVAGDAAGKMIGAPTKILSNTMAQTLAAPNTAAIPAAPVILPPNLRSGSELAPEELMREAQGFLAREQARLAGANYAKYPGKTISPMSTLTQKARENRTASQNKAAPYAKKLETVLARENRGFSPEQVAATIALLQQGQTGVNQKLANVLENQLRGNYRPELVNRKATKDFARNLPEFEANLADTSRAAGTLETKRNTEIAKLLQSLQEGKKTRAEGVIKMQEEFGNQKHTYNNIANNIRKGQFEKEQNWPQERLARLAQALNGASLSDLENAHPDFDRSNVAKIAQSLRAYGIDPSKPSSQWGTSNKGFTPYRGELIAELPQEIQTSYDIAERMAPNIKDSYSAQRKSLVKSLIDNGHLGDRAIQNLPPALMARTKELDRQAKNKLKEDIRALSQKYIRLNQYGSPQYVMELEKRKRDIGKSVLESRNKLLHDTLGKQLLLEHEGEAANIAKVGSLANVGQQEFIDLLKKQYDVNRLGANKWRNRQDENEELYKNFENQAAWEWPHLRQQINRHGVSQGFNSALNLARQQYGLEVEELRNKLAAAYSETDRERQIANNLNNQIRSTQQAEQQRLNQIREQQQQEIQRRRDAEVAQYQRNVEAATVAERNRIMQQKPSGRRVAGISINRYQ